MTLFRALANLGEELSSTRSRLKLAGLIAAFLTSLASEEVAPATRLIIGRVFPEGDARILNVSGSAVVRVLERLLGKPEGGWWDTGGDEGVDFGQTVQLLLEHAGYRPQGESPGLLEIYRVFEEIAGASGPGSRERKDDLLEGLLRRASPLEAKYIVKTVVREMRHGVNEGLVLEGIARAAGVPAPLVRKANQSTGDIGLVASLALSKGAAGLEHLPPQLGRALKPMLAQTAADVEEAFAVLGGNLALEYKLDGARVQIHKQGDQVRLFSRQLSDLTVSLPEVAKVVRQEVTAQSVILEGEVIAISAKGRPLPFQRLMQRLGRVHDIAEAAAQVATKLFLFDALYEDGRVLLDLPYAERWKVLQRVRGGIALAPRIVPRTVEEGKAFLAAARAAGHEGIMAKSLDSTYLPGVRGQAWLKIKPVVTLDLVVVAADWGYGRRHGWLSNYHLAARDEDSGEFLIVGKTFKGLTDAEFKAVTERLLSLKIAERRGTVQVRPEIVAEVAFNNIQRSPPRAARASTQGGSHSRSGMALRFARIVRFRDDKTPAEADTIQTMRRLYDAEAVHGLGHG